MKCKIQKNKKNMKTSRAIIQKTSNYLCKLPREMIFEIVSKMKYEDRKNFRGTSRTMKEIVDYEQNWEFKRFQLSKKPDQHIPIYHFANRNFTPPILHELIKSSTQENSIGLRNLEKRETLLTDFLEQAQNRFQGTELRILYTLTLLDLMKSLTDSKYTVSPPMSRDNIIISFNIQKIFIGILWASKSLSHFAFDNDFASIPVILSRILSLKEKIPLYSPVDFQRNEYLDLGDKMVIIGSRLDGNWRQKLRSPLTTQCHLHLQGSSSGLQAIRDFMENGTFDWGKVDEFQATLILKSREAHKCNNLRLICVYSFQ